MAHYIPALAALTSAMWALVDLELEETISSTTPIDPVQHLALLASLRAAPEAQLLAPFLGWIVPAGTPGAIALEGNGVVWTTLGTETVAGIVSAKLVLRANSV